MTRAKDIATLLSTANGKIAGNNLDVSFENITDTGTEGTRVATGTTAQRGSTAGQLRFNTTTGLAEYYTGTSLKAIDTPPTITSVDVTNVATDSGGTETFIISGSLFDPSVSVKFRDNGGTLITPDTTARNSASQITITKTRSSFLNANEPYDIIVTNPSGLEATLDDAISVDNDPVWQTASGNLVTINETDTGTHATVSATDSDGDTVAYSVVSGSLGGLSLDASSGVISGDPTDVSVDTTVNFTLRATANGKTADRAFNIIVANVPTGTSSSEPFTTFTHAGIAFPNNGDNGVRYFEGTSQYLLYFENFNGTVYAGIPIADTSKTEGSRSISGATYWWDSNIYVDSSHGTGALAWARPSGNQMRSNGGTGSGSNPNQQEVLRKINLGINFRYFWVDDFQVEGHGNNSADWSSTTGAVTSSNGQVTFSDSCSIVVGKSGDYWNVQHATATGNATFTEDFYSPASPKDLTNTDNTEIILRASGDKDTEYYTIKSGMIFFRA